MCSLRHIQVPRLYRAEMAADTREVPMTVTTVGEGRSRTANPPYRLSIEMAGFLTLLLGAWGGIIPYVGPTFGFSADGAPSWTWNLAHSMLFLVPGAAAVVAGLLIMVEGLSTGPARRSVLGLAGLLAAICGAWFVIGPIAWPAVNGPAFFSGASAVRELEYWIGYSLGPGALLLACGAFVLGRPRANSTPIA